MRTSSTFTSVLETFTRRLLNAGALLRKDVANLTKYQIVLSREQFRKNPPTTIMGAQRGMVEGDYALCISLYHGYELLLQMGMRSLYSYLEGIMDGSKGMTRARNELCRNSGFMEMYEQLKTMFANGSSLACSQKGSGNRKQFIYSHPKLQKLEEVVEGHFKTWAESGDPNTSDGKVGGANTRVMIFSSFRDSVQEIAEMLSKHGPLVRVMTFVGHSSGKNTKGFTQKEQLEVMKRFREGGYNTLVSTCVGEEGLDIGEVDLIICFDAQKSPIRLVQRMGRTGRKRQGRIVVLLAEGREERNYNQSQCSKRNIYKTILGNGNKSFRLYTNSPRMIPNGLIPVAHKMHITTGKYESSNVSSNSKQGRKSTIVLPESFTYRRTPVIKSTKSKEDGLLTPEEFEFWDRKFRLESDDLGTPKLVPISFESVKDEPKAVDQESGAIHELSLSEWSLWQNRPFSTHFVEHSDRCRHFISIMDMIDLMRQEGNDGSYSLDFMSYLNMDDIFEASPTLQPQVGTTSRANNQAIRKMDQLMKLTRDRKKCISNSVKQNNFPPKLTHEDEECSLFNKGKIKRTKVQRSPSCPETAKTKEAHKPPDCVSRNRQDQEAAFTPKDHSTKPGEQIHQPEREIEMDINNDLQEVTWFSGSDMRESPMKLDLNVNSAASESANAKCKSADTREKEHRDLHHCETIADYPARKLIAETQDLFFKFHKSSSANLGYNSRSNETSTNCIDLSKLFYLPDSLSIRGHSPQLKFSNTNPGGTWHSYAPEVEHPNSDSQVPTSVKMVLERVTSFLASSPPSLDMFPFCEEANSEENRRQTNILKIPPENVLIHDHGDNQFFGGSPPINIQPTDLATGQEPEDLSDHVYAGSSPSWDDLFDSNIEENVDKDYEAQSCVNQEELLGPLRQHHNSTDTNRSRSNKTLKDFTSDAPSVHEKSLPLFEDEPSLDGSSTLCAPGYKSCATIQDVPELVRHSTVLNESCQNTQAVACKSLKNGETEHDIICSPLLRKSFHKQMCCENSYIDQHRPVVDDSNMHNSSDELFAVNFDLGFSFEDLDENSDALITNDVNNKTTEFSERPIGKSPSNNTEITTAELDECISPIRENCTNKVTSKLFEAGTEALRDCSTPESGKNVSLKTSKAETLHHNEKHLTTQDLALFSPICQSDLYASSAFPPALGSFATPQERSSSLKLCRRTSINTLFKNDMAISQNPALSNVTEDLVKKGALSESTASPNTSGNILSCSTSEKHGKKSLICNKRNIFRRILDSPINGGCNSESDDEVIRRPSKRIKVSVLESPEVTGTSELDSPVLANWKSRKILNLAFSDSEDDDFRATSTKNNKDAKLSRNTHHSRKKHVARQFLDEEAELSSAGAENVSSDEDDSDNVNDDSFQGFINDASQLSQVISDGDMQQIYLKSVRSPHIYNKRKMVHSKNEMTIFSQIPEQDETYMEDSFCVREEGEETDDQSELNDDEIVNFDLFNDTPIGKNKKCATLNRTRAIIAETEDAKDTLTKRKKGSRIILLNDSSEDEHDVNQSPIKPLVQTCKHQKTAEQQSTILCSPNSTCGGDSFTKPLSKLTVQQPTCVEKGKPSLDGSLAMRLNLQASVSETIDFQMEQKHSRRFTSTIAHSSMQDKVPSEPQRGKLHSINSMESSTFSRPSEIVCKDDLIDVHQSVSHGTAPLKVLVDSREISSGPNLVSCIRLKHGIRAEICCLNGCDYIVSNRMAVERIFLSEFGNSVNRSKLVDRIQHLQAMFERVCIIVEKDGMKPGETSKIFQRTRYYDALLSSLTVAGIRILFSSSQEETAGLIAELARVEERKNAAITVPLEAHGLRQQVLQFYLSIPDISYITALNLCHRFNSVKEVANSSVAEIASRGKVGHRRAEEIYRYVHYVFDPQMVPDHGEQKSRKQN
ncbi:Fanconi anemia group M protein isoform X2 [Scyliorhinus canicula]|uniref:Fanconi anemia group M protein isoform X2 n=1 Tax=Scyliorhinus canicula TaxID=7830 RepID=UPI0018F5BADD|nr:Fanconi anemia group M protein isoform X2 [Scyliorhinus canicula]